MPLFDSCQVQAAGLGVAMMMPGSTVLAMGLKPQEGTHGARLGPLRAEAKCNVFGEIQEMKACCSKGLLIDVEMLK